MSIYRTEKAHSCIELNLINWLEIWDNTRYWLITLHFLISYNQPPPSVVMHPSADESDQLQRQLTTSITWSAASYIQIILHLRTKKRHSHTIIKFYISTQHVNISDHQRKGGRIFYTLSNYCAESHICNICNNSYRSNGKGLTNFKGKIERPYPG